MLATGFLVAIILLISALLAVAHRRFGQDDDPLVAAIDDLLPQTQCAQCGYPGCRPYAQALVQGEAVDLCPPGGEDTVQTLLQLLPQAPRSTAALAEPPQLLARIDETRCIGCYLCIDACPVDAIIGAPKLMHTVLQSACTGCELCVAPCPVDCIEMHAL